MGAQVSYNLSAQRPANREVAKAGVDVAEEQRLAMAMAVVSQVHIANMNFVQSRQITLSPKNILTCQNV